MDSFSVTCRFCDFEDNLSDIELDKNMKGYWCNDCDGYNFLDPSAEAHRFTLAMESTIGKNKLVTNGSTIKFNKRLSPLRYPGGKSKTTDYIYSKLRPGTKFLASPYAGGAGAELALLQAGVIEKLILNDLDYGIYSLFWTIKHAPWDLIQRIESTNLGHKDFFKAQAIIKSDYKNCTLLEAAWSILVTNRLAYSGIYKANPLGGKAGNSKTLLSRWNPSNLIQRIKIIHSLSDKIEIYNMNANAFIEEYYWLSDTTLLIDPPYVQKGAQLYKHYYLEDDHLQLNSLLESLHKGFPCADILLFYDDDPLINAIYQLPVIEKISRVFSI